MKKIYTLLSILLLTILLAACGTDNVNESADPETPTENIEEPNQPEEETEKPEETTQAEGETENSPLPIEELEGTQTESETQNYKITVIEGFELTAEEPNKDLLFNQENDQQSMRIETFSKDDATIDGITKNLIDTLEASNDNGTLEEITDQNQIPTNESIENMNAYQIDTPDGKVIGYTFERDGLLVKLTVFDTTEAQAVQDFVKMAATIQAK
ncbi:hypothetical protein [Psychrobacillus sp. OK032]|uniref:hypothetical protein n=1 Tax=Psychrobacillus sp. OK032 TaxID=1884358 RepID=UPI0008D1632E|nr:hypothetical protein [Psychrobacillus sp. OK032]SER61859.1 hypothetical protein SAMN05518872_101370 [Psychrobacillus sp. OK032]